MKNGFGGIVAAIAAVVVLVLVYSSAFVVDPMRQALVLQFGEVREIVKDPGLSFKRPFIQNVEYLPKLILDLDQSQQEIIAADQKRLTVSAFARYRISDPKKFYETVRTVAKGNERLQAFMSSNLRAVLAEAPFSAIVRDQRAQLMDRIRAEVDKSARELGVEIVDVRIRRADLPEQNRRAIFERMKTERLREATELRARGDAESQRINAQADAERTITVAEATRDANRLKGEGEATRARIFAEAYGKDPEFFAFYRSLQAYETALRSGDPKMGDTRLVMSPSSDFFRYFSDPMGRSKFGATPQTGIPVPAAPPAAVAEPAPKAADPAPVPAPAQ